MPNRNAFELMDSGVIMLRRVLSTIGLALIAPLAHTQAFDHSHAAWDGLLAKHLKVAADGKSSRVDYKGFANDRAQLGGYLKSLSAVPAAEYAKWSKPQQYSFLANAYNAFTIEKILTRHPNLKSIRDFGTVFGNPWKDRFFTLLDREQHLDGIENETMRAPGSFDDPRVHVAVNCAAIGCPMLGNRAFTADKLDAQLDELMKRFLSDRTRNRYNAQTKSLEMSRIFDWYKADYEKDGKSFLGYTGFASVPDVAARYVDVLADSDADRAALRAKSVPVHHLEYDWSLNDTGR